MFSRARCPAPTIAFYDRQTQKPNTDCDAYRTATIAAINQLRPSVVVVTSASLSQTVSKDAIATADMWLAGMTTTLKGLAAPGTRVVLLGDMPVLEQTNPECLAAHTANIQQCGSTRVEALTGVYTEAERDAANSAGAEYIDVTNGFCADRCSPVVAGRQVYRNRFHITAAFATYVAGAVAQTLHRDH